MKHEDIMLSEIIQTQKDKYMTPLIRDSQNRQIQRQKVGKRSSEAGGRGEWGGKYSISSDSVWEDEKVLNIDGGDDCMTHC